jgi:hypothetical protein
VNGTGGYYNLKIKQNNVGSFSGCIPFSVSADLDRLRIGGQFGG